MSNSEAWHFLRADKHLRYWPFTQVEVGQKLTYDQPPQLCIGGLHASYRLIDAIKYAPGPVLCRVSLGGAIVEGLDKVAAQERTCLAMVEASRLLHGFAMKCVIWYLKRYKYLRNPAVRLTLAAKTKWSRGKIDSRQMQKIRNEMWQNHHIDCVYHVCGTNAIDCLQSMFHYFRDDVAFWNTVQELGLKFERNVLNIMGVTTSLEVPLAV
jgi:hypothetical protein